MTGETILLQFCMGWNERAGRYHLVRIEEKQSQQRHQRDCNSCEKNASCTGTGAHHFQFQNRQMAMICASASPAKANVIGTWITRHCLMTFIARLST